MKSLKIYILPFFAIIICFLAVNSWSLWVDEANTAVICSVASFNDLIGLFQKYLTTGSIPQQPGFVISLWFWVKAFGNSEYALRFPNIMYMLILLGYTFSLIKSKITTKNEKLFLILVLTITFLNPFILYNMNEARANIATFFFSYMTLLNLLFYFKKKRSYFITLFTLFAFLGSSFNMLFLFTFIGLILIALFLSKNIWSDLKENIRSVSIFTVFMIPMILYYLYTIYVGGGGQRETPGLGNIGFSIYEFLGFSGLGPARDTLREINQNSTFTNLVYSLIGYAGLIIPLIISYIFLIVYVIKNEGIKFIIRNKFLIAFCSAFVLFFIVAFIVKFRFWGRHVIFLLPFLIFFIAELLQNIISKKGKIIKFIIPLLFIMLSLSSFRIIYNPEYKKEDAKLAAFECKKMVLKGESIIWLFDKDEGKYYEIDKLGNPIIGITNNSVHGLLVWYKKFDYYDQHGVFRKFMNFKKGKTVLLFSHKDFNIYRVSQ
jgi:hypothetical protein